MTWVPGGNPPQRPDQLLQQLTRAGSGPSPQSPVVVAQIVIIGGPHGGVFVYAPHPGAGNLIGSIAGTAGTDSFGNPYLAGITDYVNTGGAAGLTVQLFNGIITFLDQQSVNPVTHNSSAGVIHQSLSGQAPVTFLDSPSTNSSGLHAALWLVGEGLIAPSGAQDSTVSVLWNGSSPSTFAALIAGALKFATISSGLAVANVFDIIPPSGDATGVTDTANLASSVSAGATPYLLPGTWNFNPGNATLTTLSPGQYIYGAGKRNTFINVVGTGIAFAWTFVGVFSAATTRSGGFLGGATIDLTNAGNGSEGIRCGNIFDLEWDVEIVDTSGRTPALKGFHALNDINYTENLKGYVGVHGCTITFDVSDGPAGPFNKTSTGSFKGIDMKLYTNQRGIIGNNGLEVHNGANLYDGTVVWTGNFEGAASGSAGAALDLTGTVPAGHTGAGNGSSFRDDILQWGPEVTTTGVVNPVSINFGGASNVIAECAGVIDFGSGADLQRFTGSNWPGTGSFFGPISGDTTLAGLSRMAPGPLTLDNGLNIGHGGAAQALVNNSTITTAGLTYAPVSLAAAVTGIIVQAGTFSGQVIYISSEAGPASGFTITFAVAGSNVRDPGTLVQPGTAAMMAWDEHVSLWIRVH